MNGIQYAHHSRRITLTVFPEYQLPLLLIFVFSCSFQQHCHAGYVLYESFHAPQRRKPDICYLTPVPALLRNAFFIVDNSRILAFNNNVLTTINWYDINVATMSPVGHSGESSRRCAQMRHALKALNCAATPTNESKMYLSLLCRAHMKEYARQANALNELVCVTSTSILSSFPFVLWHVSSCNKAEF